MTTKKIGGLNTIAEWEELLKTLQGMAGGPEGLGKFWQREDPPRVTGQDPIVKQGWRLAVIRGVEFRLPEDASILSTQNEVVGEYQFVRVHGVNVHLRDGIKVVDGAAVGDVHICVKVTWPKGAEERQFAKPGWRNYFFCLDIFPATEEATHVLWIFPENTPREREYMYMFDFSEKVKDGELGTVQARAWATRSANWRPPRGSEPGTGSDQCLCVYKK